MPWDLLVATGLHVPSPEQFVRDASDRLISSFFLGSLLVFSCERVIFDPVLAALISSAFRFISRPRLRPSSRVNAGLLNTFVPEKSSGLDTPSGSLTPRRERSRLSFALTVCFAMAALAQTISLGNFSVSGGSAACAFVVAWGSIAAQSARITGLLRLSFDLVALGVKRWQLIVLWSWLCAAIVLMFVSSATSVGTLVELSFVPGTAVCNRKHFLPTSLPLSLTNIILEGICSVKFFLLVAPEFLSGADRLRALLDIGVLRALSLLLLDLLTVAPTAAFFSIPADFVPFSIGAVLVLTAFNHVPGCSSRAPSVVISVSPRSAPLVHLSPPERSQTRLSFSSLVHPPVSRLHRSLPPTPRQSTRSDNFGPVLHIRRSSRSDASASPTSTLSKDEGPPATRSQRSTPADRGPPLTPPGIPLPSRPPPQELQAPMYRGSVASPLSEGGTLEPGVVMLAYREALQSLSRNNFAPWDRSSMPNAPPGSSPRVASSTIEFASPRTSLATTLGHSTSHRASLAPSLPPLPPMHTLPQISVQLPSAAPPSARQYGPPQTTPSEAISPAGSSVIFGSDVLRRPRRSVSLSTTDHRASMESAPYSAPPTDALRRASTASSRMPRRSDDLSVVYESSLEAPGPSAAAPARRPTFGESAFRSAGVMPLSSRWSPDSQSRSEGSHPSNSTSSGAT